MPRWAGIALPVASLALLAVLLGALIVGLQSFQEQVRAVTATAELCDRIGDVRTELLNAETSQRGYILTRERRYVSIYERASRAVPDAVMVVRERTVADPAQQQRVDEVQRLSNAKLEELAETVRLAERGEFDAALLVVRSGRGKAAMDALRTVLGEMEHAENERLRLRQERAGQVGRAMLVLALFALGALVATVLSYRMWHREFARQRRTNEEKSRLLEALARSAERLASLHELDGAILRAESPASIATAAAERMAALLGAAYVSVLLHDEGRHEVAGLVSDVELPAARGDRVSTPASLTTKLSEGAPMVARDLASDEPLHAFEAPLRGAGVRTIVTAALTSDREVVGTLNVGLRRDGKLEDSEREVLSEVAAQLAIAFHQARLLTALRRHADELEATVAARTAALQEANADLEAFSYSVSHDLRAPLRGMQGYALALVEDYGDKLDDVARGYANKIVAAALRMENLIQDLLQYGRLNRESIVARPSDLRSVVAEALQQVASDVAETGASVELIDPLPRVNAHRPTLVLCVQNLLTNAIKFVAPGTAARIEVFGEQKGSFGRLWVVDHGLGIAPEHHARIFQVFERLHSADRYPGTGIGLAIVKRAVERMGGDVGVESEPGKGAKFWLQLPLARDSDAH